MLLTDGCIWVSHEKPARIGKNASEPLCRSIVEHSARKEGFETILDTPAGPQLAVSAPIAFGNQVPEIWSVIACPGDCRLSRGRHHHRPGGDGYRLDDSRHGLVGQFFRGLAQAAQTTGGSARQVLEAAADLSGQADRLRQQVDHLLAKLRRA